MKSLMRQFVFALAVFVGVVTGVAVPSIALAQAPGEIPTAEQAAQRQKVIENAREKAREKVLGSRPGGAEKESKKNEEETLEPGAKKKLSKEEEKKIQRKLDEEERKKAEQDALRARYSERWVKPPQGQATIGSPMNRPGDGPTTYTVPSVSSGNAWITPSEKKEPPQMKFATLQRERLPLEAHQTLLLLQRGGPFPFAQDGSTFQNRERRLPQKPRGYYREFTVPTPGSPDRGMRRLISGNGGELYYTDNHYRSFKQVVN